MPTVAFEIDEIQRLPMPSLPKTALPASARIGSGVALAAQGRSGRWKDNPHHWQTLILLLPILHNPDHNGYRKPIAKFLIDRTIHEIQSLFSGYTLTRAMGWYWDDVSAAGLSDDLVRFELDGVFTGNDLRALHDWKKKLKRRFKQNYIYMHIVPSGMAL